MIYGVYAIYDRLAICYTEPHLEINDECAKRWFEGILSASKFRNSDFDLVKIGTYNASTGVLVSDESKKIIMVGVDNV